MEISFNNDYKNLLSFSRLKIAALNLNVDPEDLLNDAYIVFHYSGTPYSAKEFKKCITKIAYKQKSEPLLVQISESGLYNKDVETHKSCKGCQMDLPLDCFYAWSKEYEGRKKYRTYCKKCEIKRFKDWKQKNKPAPKRNYNKKPKPEYPYELKPIKLKIIKLTLKRL